MGLRGPNGKQLLTAAGLGWAGVLIALSGYSTDDARQKGKDSGFDHYLVKPAGFDDLKRVIPEIG